MHATRKTNYQGETTSHIARFNNDICLKVANISICFCHIYHIMQLYHIHRKISTGHHSSHDVLLTIDLLFYHCVSQLETNGGGCASQFNGTQLIQRFVNILPPCSPNDSRTTRNRVSDHKIANLKRIAVFLILIIPYGMGQIWWDLNN